MNPPSDCSGQFIWCVKIHEDELCLVEPDILRPKNDGTTERVNLYKVYGKQRPALVLRDLREGGKCFIVWYTCTDTGSVEQGSDVSYFTKPDLPKKAFLRPHPDEIRLVPHTPTWCGNFVARADKVIFDSYLLQAQKIPFVRL